MATYAGKLCIEEKRGVYAVKGEGETGPESQISKDDPCPADSFAVYHILLLPSHLFQTASGVQVHSRRAVRLLVLFSSGSYPLSSCNQTEPYL